MRAAEGGEAGQYMVGIALVEWRGRMLFWNTDYPEVIKLARALDNLYA